MSTIEGLCAESASQNLSATLPNVYEIEKIIVETQEYNRDEHLNNMVIKNLQVRMLIKTFWNFRR